MVLKRVSSSSFLFDMNSKSLFNASTKDEKVEIGLDASFEFYFDVSLEDEETEDKFDTSFKLISEFWGDTLFLSFSLSLSLSHIHTQRIWKKK